MSYFVYVVCFLYVTLLLFPERALKVLTSSLFKNISLEIYLEINQYSDKKKLCKFSLSVCLFVIIFWFFISIIYIFTLDTLSFSNSLCVMFVFSVWVLWLQCRGTEYSYPIYLSLQFYCKLDNKTKIVPSPIFTDYKLTV